MRTRDTFFAQSTDSHEVNFANADTSSLIDAVIYFSSLKVKKPFSWQNVAVPQRYNTLGRMIARLQFQTFFGVKRVMQKTVLIE